MTKEELKYICGLYKILASTSATVITIGIRRQVNDQKIRGNLCLLKISVFGIGFKNEAVKLLELKAILAKLENEERAKEAAIFSLRKQMKQPTIYRRESSLVWEISV